MPEDTLNILILAKDEASSVFKKIGGAAKSAFKAMSVAALAGGTAVAAGFGLALREAAMTEEIINELNQVIESTGGVAGITSREAQELARSFQNVTKFSDEMIMRGETLLLTFTNIGEDVFPRTVETMLNMGEAFGSVDGAAIQLGKALNDPVAGISALSDVGVSFTQDQKDMVAAMMEAGDIMGAQTLILDELEKEFGGVARAAGEGLAGQLTILKNNLQDVAVAIGNLALPAVTGFTSGIIEAVQSIVPMIDNIVRLVRIADKFGATSEQFEFMSEMIGKSLPKSVLSAVTAFVKFRDNVGKAMDYARAVIESVNHSVGKAGLEAVLRSLFTTWQGGLTYVGSFLMLLGLGADASQKIGVAFNWLANALMDTLIPAFNLLKNTIVPFIVDHLPGILSAFAAIGAILAGAAIYGQIMAIVAALVALANPITYIIAAVALLAVAWTEDWLGIRSAIMNDVWPAIQPILSALWGWLKVALPDAAKTLKEQWDKHVVPAMATIVDYWNVAFKPALVIMWGWIRTFIPNAIDWLVEKWGKLKEGIATLVDYWNVAFKPALLLMWGYLKNFIPNAIDWLVDKWDEFKEAISVLVDYWNTAFKPALLIMWGYLKNFIPNAIDTVKNKFNELKEQAFQALVDFLVSTAIPAFISLRDTLTAIKTRVNLIATQVKDVLLIAWQEVTDYITGTAQGAWDTFKNTIGEVRSKISAVATLLANYALDAFDAITAFIRDTVQPVWDTLKDALTIVVQKISGLVTLFNNAFKTALETIQPLVDALGTGFSALKSTLEPLASLLSGIGDALGWVGDNIPDALMPGSLPPLAQGIKDVGEQFAFAAAQGKSFSRSMSGFKPPRMGGVSDISSFGEGRSGGVFQDSSRRRGPDLRNINYTLIVNSNARTEPIAQDFRFMQAWNRSI